MNDVSGNENENESGNRVSVSENLESVNENRVNVSENRENVNGNRNHFLLARLRLNSFLRCLRRYCLELMEGWMAWESRFLLQGADGRCRAFDAL